MLLTGEIEKAISGLFAKAAQKDLTNEDYEELCRSAGVSRMYYDMTLENDTQYRDMATGMLVTSEVEKDNAVILYDDGNETELVKKYTYYYEGNEYVHAYVAFKKGVKEEDLNQECFQFLSDVVYMLVSRQNMRLMLDFAETHDAQTGIPNGSYLGRFYYQCIHRYPENRYLVIFINLHNFKFLNKQGGTRTGDEGIVRYARTLYGMMEKDEGVCRLGGDNFVLFIKKQNLDRMIENLHGITIENLESAHGKDFTISAWIGISRDNMQEPFGQRLEQANIACILGKNRLKQTVVFYTEELAHMMDRTKQIIGMFHPAIANREFKPYFQAKVDMTTGKLVGFEALCRWLHEGNLIYPDQFIPALDSQGLIHELDMEILRLTCESIRKWKDLGLNPPPVSVNLSRKNIFVPHIEDKILSIIKENGIDTSSIEVEITETATEEEYLRLVDFINQLKQYGLLISIDDFGTGYSSLSLIHNINADVIKIDKSFVDALFTDEKSSVLVESIITLADRLGMKTIAEGVETAMQGMTLVGMGCKNAQGYYYSKPADYEATTEILKKPPYKPIPET
ncbi:MAG: EAL domain-containing protein [Lachnospiraceae bacterium]|nr:EAL domain-containing protein [Lachnospiraceae bacterium]